MVDNSLVPVRGEPEISSRLWAFQAFCWPKVGLPKLLLVSVPASVAIRKVAARPRGAAERRNRLLS